MFKLANADDALFADYVIAEKFGLRQPSLHKHWSHNFIVSWDEVYRDALVGVAGSRSGLTTHANLWLVESLLWGTS